MRGVAYAAVVLNSFKLNPSISHKTKRKGKTVVITKKALGLHGAQE